MSFIIDPSSVSFEDIKTDIQNFLSSAPDALTWKDYFATGSGSTLVDLTAALGAFIAYNVVVARREGFLPYAQNNSSVVAEAQTLGYSAFRGRNAILDVTITPTTSTLLGKYTIIGTVKDQDLILLEDTAINLGVNATLRCVIGTPATETQTINTTGPSTFRFTKSNVSDDVRLFLNSVEMPTSSRVLDLINQKFSVVSNVLGSVDVGYLNLDTYTIRYNVGDVLELQWVTLNNLQYSASDVQSDIGTLVSFVVVSLFQAPETTASVKVNAPLFNETQFVIRGRDDYMKALRLLNQNILSTAYTDVSAAVVDLCYVQIGACLFSNSALAGFINQLSIFRPMGLQPPTISHPKIDFLELDVVVTALNSSGNPSTAVETVLSGYESILEQSMVLKDVEHAIIQYPYVKIARIAIHSDVWAANTTYRLGKHVRPSPANGSIYKFNAIAYFSGASEPTWPNAVPLTQSVTDGGIVWCMVDMSTFCPPITPSAWQAHHRYKKGDVVAPTGGILSVPNPPGPNINVGFIACDFINKSGAGSPAVAAAVTYVGPIVSTLTVAGVQFAACFGGAIGNVITLTFNGINTVQQVVDNWNIANPSNCVVFNPQSANTQVIPAQIVTLGGGADTSSVPFTAQAPGAAGNNISLTFNGFASVTSTVANYNGSHVQQVNGSGTMILPNNTNVTLINGIDANTGEPIWPGSLLPPC